MSRRTTTAAEWRAEAARLFGPDPGGWRFVCPSCGHVASVRSWEDLGATPGEIGFSCVGRHMPSARDAFTGGPGPCNYAGGGLFQINPVSVTTDAGVVRVFEFAPAAEVAP
jgi:hypothetical protein